MAQLAESCGGICCLRLILILLHVLCTQRRELHIIGPAGILDSTSFGLHHLTVHLLALQVANGAIYKLPFLVTLKVSDTLQDSTLVRSAIESELACGLGLAFPGT